MDLVLTSLFYGLGLNFKQQFQALHKKILTIVARALLWIMAAMAGA